MPRATSRESLGSFWNGNLSTGIGMEDGKHNGRSIPAGSFRPQLPTRGLLARFVQRRWLDRRWIISGCAVTRPEQSIRARYEHYTLEIYAEENNSSCFEEHLCEASDFNLLQSSAISKGFTGYQFRQSGYSEFPNSAWRFADLYRSPRMLPVCQLHLCGLS